MYFLLVIVCILLNKTVCWREASRCTTSGAVASADSQSSQNSNAGRTLKIDCNGDLIYIAWSHYGHRTSENNNNMLRSQLAPLLSNETIDEGCYFSPKDCLVSVDYVANECNGLGSCQISLDAQYLHSCKSYSDYLFIVYECYPVRDTVDVCDEGYESQAEIGGDDNDTGAVYYVKTPNYPNEYSNNLECNCSIRTQTYNDSDNGRQTMMEIEMLEFDLEGSSTNENDDNMASLVSYNLNTFSQQQPQLTGTGRRQFNNNNNNQPQMCTRDYFSVNVNKNLCGSLSPFATFYNLISTKTTKQPTNDLQHQITKLKFTSDDALTRRGFWMKLKISSNRKASCPDNFILINNICLRVYDQDMSWYEAHQFCTKQGYSLALIDNFELEKQLNKIIYDHGNDTILEGLFAFRKLVRNGPNGPVRKFWTGIRHLNETSWFDFKNELIKFRPDESNWWPWLIMDAATYSQGSCVAKRKNHFFLDDCYKRMPFACQAKPVESAPSRSSSSGARTKVHFKCGKNSHIFEQPEVQPQRSTIAAVQTSNVTKRAQSSPQFYSNEDANANRLEKIAQVDLDADNLRLPVKISASESNSNRNDSSILIGLVCAITLIIASINTAVIIIFCKKRKFLMKEQNNESTDKESKTSSQDTINRNHHLHHHTHHGDLNLLDDGTIIVGNLNNSLSYNCLTSTTTTNQKKPIFISAAASNNHHSNGHLNQSNSEGYNYLNNNFNQTNLRRSVFLTNTNDQNNRQLIANISSMAKTLAKSNTKLTAAASQPGQNNDPLSHIYETISVSSNMMDTPIIAAHHYNCRFNRNLLLEANNKNPYNELECDQPPSTYNDSSIATSTTNDSTSSHKSHDLFLINLDSINNNKKSLSNKDFNNLMYKQHLQSQQQNQQLFAKYPATSSDVHHATMSNKYLLQRLQTNQLLLNNPNSINSNHLNFGHVTSAQQQTATTMYRTVNNQQQQQQHFVDDFVDPQTVGDIFTSRIEAVV